MYDYCKISTHIDPTVWYFCIDQLWKILHYLYNVYLASILLE